jgi:hypothetical protein
MVNYCFVNYSIRNDNSSWGSKNTVLKQVSFKHFEYPKQVGYHKSRNGVKELLIRVWRIDKILWAI